MGILSVGRYTNLQARKNVLERTAASYEHLMMTAVLKLAKSAVMATAR
jgi:hypothetical protein